MTPTFDADKFALAVRVRRGGKSLRAAARESGVSASTLSRIERGSPPDVDSLYALAAWLSVPLSLFSFQQPATKRTLDQRIAENEAGLTSYRNGLDMNTPSPRRA
jgi:transcriptional regulator with XRE-family HTH domain